MIITLVWIDKKWKSKGIAHNVWLWIYPDDKCYKKIITAYIDTSGEHVIEIARKSDIDKMINNLNHKGYTEIA